MSRDREKSSFLGLLCLTGEGCLLVVQPVNEKRHTIDWDHGPKWNISNRIDRSSDEKVYSSSLIFCDSVAPYSADIVVAIGKEDIRNTPSG